MKKLIVSLIFSVAFSLCNASGVSDVSAENSSCMATASGFSWDLKYFGSSQPCVTNVSYKLEMMGSSCNLYYCITVQSGGAVSGGSCKDASNGDLIGSRAFTINGSGTADLVIRVDMYYDLGGGNYDIGDFAFITVPKCNY